MAEWGTTDPAGLRPDNGLGEVLLSVVYSLYRAVPEDGRWPILLHEIEALIGADACALSVHDFGTGRGAIAVHSGCFEAADLAAYRETFAPINPWLSRESYYRASDAVWTGEDIVPHRRLVASAFHAGWLRPLGLAHRCSVTLFREHDRAVYIEAFRGARRQPFMREELFPLQRLIAHLKQSLELRWMVTRVDPRSLHPMGDMVLRMGSAPAILAAQQDLLAARRSEGAENAPVDAGDAERARDGRDVLPAREEEAAPEAAAGGDSRDCDEADPAPIMPVALIAGRADEGEGPATETTHRRRRWLPLVLHNEEAQGPDDDGLEDINVKKLRQLYGLTRTEARLAVMIASGVTLAAAAAKLDITPSTARTHLQRIFGKTDTHYQVELVALLLRGPAQIKVAYHRDGGEPPSRDGKSRRG
ncbi:MAG TPA: LuxR C-terminal-related transcriptional regulator [Alphaproteobacteria bacterium]